MALKDISPTTIANILALIATANSFANDIVKNSRSFKEIPTRIKKVINPEPNDASSALKKWFDTNIKSGAPGAGTATVSSKFTTQKEWETGFFTTRIELLPNVPPAVMAALDAWYTRYTTYKITGKGKW
jgi:hypothetical protein